MQVVQREQKRLLIGEVGRHPEKAMEHRLRPLRVRLGAEVSRIEDRLRESRRTREKLGPLLLGCRSQNRFEELPDDPIGDALLELRAPRSENPHAHRPTPSTRLSQEARLPDARWAFDREQLAARRRGGDECVERGKLGVAFEQVGPAHGRALRVGRRSAGRRKGFRQAVDDQLEEVLRAIHVA